EHVGAVEPLALLHEGLRPDHFLGRTEPHLHAEDLSLARVGEPQIVDGGDAVARSEDHVDQMAVAVDLAEPVRKRQLGAIAGFVEQRDRAAAIAPAHEHVEIFGVALDLRVLREGEGAADEIRDDCVGEPHECVPVKRRRGIVDRACGQRLHARSFLLCGYARPSRGPAAASCGTSVERLAGIGPAGVDTGGAAVTSNTRNGGRSAKRRVRSGIDTLYTFTPLVVAPSSCPRCAWPWNTSDTGYRLIGSSSRLDPRNG